MPGSKESADNTHVKKFRIITEPGRRFGSGNENGDSSQRTKKLVEGAFYINKTPLMVKLTEEHANEKG